MLQPCQFAPRLHPDVPSKVRTYLSGRLSRDQVQFNTVDDVLRVEFDCDRLQNDVAAAVASSPVLPNYCNMATLEQPVRQSLGLKAT